MSAAPRYRSHAWHEIGTVGVLIALWMVPWLALTAATWVAGGHPSASPAAFINPSDVARRLHSGIGPLEWWELVSPTSTVVAWRFWTSLSLIGAAVTICVIGARMQVAGMPQGRFRRFLPSARRVVRVGRWARPVDLRSLRGRPGRGGVFLQILHKQSARIAAIVTISSDFDDFTFPNIPHYRGIFRCEQIAKVQASHRTLNPFIRIIS